MTTSGSTDVYLNLGCGLDAPEGWQNIDRSPSIMLGRFPALASVLGKLGFLSERQGGKWPANVIRADVTKGLDYATSSVAAIYSSHMLEHLFLDQAEALLRECHRALRPGGVLRLALPDLEDAIETFDRDGRSAAASRRLMVHLGMHPLEKPHPKTIFVSTFGGSIHRWIPTRALLTEMLERAGFTDVRFRSYREGELPDIEAVETRPESLFVEAKR